jgi:hypothetical protein
MSLVEADDVLTILTWSLMLRVSEIDVEDDFTTVAEANILTPSEAITSGMVCE